MKDNDNRRRSGIRKVCARYDRTPATIWNWYKTGKFPTPHYVNGVRQWWDDELDEYDSKHAQTYEQRRGGAA